MYIITMIPITNKYKKEIPLKPNNSAKGVNGKIIVIHATNNVASSKCFLGLLLKNGFLVLMISTTIDAEITDSINHDVLN
jgi:hypothetical protein